MASNKRGCYKQYIYDDDVPIPRTTSHRLNKQPLEIPNTNTQAPLIIDSEILISVKLRNKMKSMLDKDKSSSSILRMLIHPLYKQKKLELGHKSDKKLIEVKEIQAYIGN